jgi:hypothetical protein
MGWPIYLKAVSRPLSETAIERAVCYDTPGRNLMRSRIMYIESKAESLQGPARIGRVTFTKSGKGICYRGQEFYRIRGFKANYAEVETHNPYWISGPRRDGRDRLYTPSGLPVEIDDDVRQEYWREIRKRPDCVTRTTT